MSKKQKKAEPTAAKRPAAAAAAPKAQRNWPEWFYSMAGADAQHPVWKYAFWGLSAAAVLLMCFLALRAGVNGDDRFQVEYSERLVDYFASFGKNKEVFYEQDEGYQQYVKYYGGAFELFAGGINRILGNDPLEPDYHQVRHLVNGAFALIIVFCMAFWARDLGGYRAAALLLVLALGSPRLLGHGVMNPKDIPFAAGYALGIYFLYRSLKNMPRPRWTDVLGFVLGAALATGQRAGGLLLFAYAGLFLGIDFLMRYGLKGLVDFKAVGRYALYWVGSSVLAFGLALLVWPYAMQDPIAHTQEALKVFSNFSVRISVLYGGDTIFSDEVPRAYPFVWIGMTLALSVLLGIVGAAALGRSIGKQFSPAAVSVLWFAALFPLFYLTYKDSALYDGWRQLLFVYPSLLLLAALFWETLIRRKAAWQWGVLAGVLLLQADAMAFTVRNASYPYVYFNALIGGIKGAHGYYETDYWAVSARPAVEWMEKEGILHANMKDTLVIGSSFPYNVSRQLDPSYSKMVKVKYVRFNARYVEDWQYGIFSNRFIRGPQLRAGKWPNSKTVHVVAANGVPLTVIEKNKTNDAYLAESALKANNLEAAMTHFDAELQAHPDNELAWMGLASATANSNRFSEALASANEALKLAPDNETGLYLKGYIELATGDPSTSSLTFSQLLKVNPENSMAYFYLAEIDRQRKEYISALKNLEKALQYNPKFKNAYLLAAQIYDERGDTANAARYREVANQL